MDELVAFTVRIPRMLCDQIEDRRRLNRRSRNAEIAFLLEQAIDGSVASDLKVLQRQPVNQSES